MTSAIEADLETTPGFLTGSGTMVRRITRHDWASTPLGPIEAWPQSLRTAVSMVINSGFPTYMVWGPELIGFYNDAYIPVLGRKEALGLPFHVVWSEAWELVQPIAQRALAGEPSFFEDMPLVLERYGYREQTYFTFSYSPIRDESGHVGGILCTVVETTANVEAARLGRFQLRLSDVLRKLSSPDEIIEAACHVLGEELGAQRVGYATVEENSIRVHATGWNDIAVAPVAEQTLPLHSLGAPLVQALNKGETACLHDVASDERAAAATLFATFDSPSVLFVPIVRGSRLIAMMAVGAASRRWSDADARLAEEAAERTRSAVERALAEQALTRQLEHDRDRMRELFEQAPVFMAVLRSPEHVYELVNAAYLRLIGRSDSAGILQRRVADIIPEAVDQGFVALLDEVYASGKPFVASEAGILLQLDPDQPPVQRFVDFIYQPVTDAEGEVTGIFVVGSDVTEKRMATDALREADRRKDEFLAMLAHELRNPLAPISTAAQLLRLAPGNPARVADAATVIVRQAGHMTRLVDDLLDVSRVTRGLITLERVPLEVESIIASAVEQARPYVESRGHVLSVGQTPVSAMVEGDRTRLVQVVVNLLNNASRYTPENGHIVLSSEVDGDEVRIRVTDTGIGIDAALLPRVFDLFTQGARTPDRSHGGLGLGLALVKSLVELHGGHVEAESAGTRLGSTFSVYLPLRSAPRDVGTTDADRPNATEPRSRRVLIVDDNVDAGDTLAQYLEVTGHVATIARTPFEAIELAGTRDFDACVLDIGLPGMDGFELARRLQAIPHLQQATFVALTGYGQPSDRDRSRAAGFAHHLVKPVDTTLLGRILG